MKYSKLRVILMLIMLTVAVVTEANPPSELKSKARFIQQLEKGEKVKIAALGTSLTGTWFYVMKDWLNETYPGQCSFYDLGVGGSASSHPPGKGGLDQVKLVDQYQPDVVFIEFAINDAFIPYNISVEQSRKNLESIIKTLEGFNPEVEIILQTMNFVIDVPEKNRTGSSKRIELTKYIKMYRKVARKKKLILIDNYPNWKRYLKKQGRDAYIKLVPDGIHPSAEAYRKIMIPEFKKELF